ETVEFDGFAARALLPREVEQPARDLLAAQGLPDDLFEVVVPLAFARERGGLRRLAQVAQRRLSASCDGGERVVDLVRHARRELADGRQTTRARELLLHLRERRDVAPRDNAPALGGVPRVLRRV